MKEKLQNVTKKKDLMKIIEDNDLKHRMTTSKTLTVTWKGQVFYYSLIGYKALKFEKVTP